MFTYINFFSIAHRLSTIRHVDRIFVFESGKIVENGAHTELIRIEDVVYRRLVLAQAIEQLDEEESSENETEKVDDKVEGWLIFGQLFF
jgi:ABC-type oligopeptide transport system ATPase subunit